MYAADIPPHPPPLTCGPGDSFSVAGAGALLPLSGQQSWARPSVHRDRSPEQEVERRLVAGAGAWAPWSSGRLWRLVQHRFERTLRIQVLKSLTGEVCPLRGFSVGIWGFGA